MFTALITTPVGPINNRNCGYSGGQKEVFEQGLVGHCDGDLSCIYVMLEVRFFLFSKDFMSHS